MPASLLMVSCSARVPAELKVNYLNFLTLPCGHYSFIEIENPTEKIIVKKIHLKCF
jgi:hypothetical protein